VETARLLAVLNTAQADAFIACWDAKFTYRSERPVTALRRQFEPGTAWRSRRTVCRRADVGELAAPFGDYTPAACELRSMTLTSS
jgi:hypothetical protein